MTKKNNPPDSLSGGLNVLLSGIDTLEIGYCINQYLLSEEDWEKIANAKSKAQSREYDNNGGYLVIKGKKFNVNRSGVPRYEYVISNNDISIRVHRKLYTKKETPELIITFRSTYLWNKGWYQAVIETEGWLKNIASVYQSKVSRVDITIDIDRKLPELDMRQFVTYARGKHEFAHEIQSDKFYHGRILEGYSIGAGTIMLRAYDKLYEINKSNKGWFKDLWLKNGWVKDSPVTRFEFQLRRKFIHEYQIDTVEDLAYQLGDLWKYLTGTWMAIKLKNDLDNNNRRWEDSELWKEIREIKIGNVSGVVRVRQAKPKYEALKKQSIGCIKTMGAMIKANLGVDYNLALHEIQVMLKEELKKDEFKQDVLEREYKLSNMS